MSGPDNDPIADAVLSDSAYERLQLRGFGLVPRPLPEKLAWQSYLLFGLAAVLPVLGALPESVRGRHPAGLGAATPRLSVVVAFAVVVLLSTGVGHAAVALRLLAAGRSISEADARSLLSVENVCSLVGFGTGGLAALGVYTLVAAAFGGPELLATTASDPFAPAPVGIPLAALAAAALLGGALLRVLSAYVYVASFRRGRDDIVGTPGGTRRAHG